MGIGAVCCSGSWPMRTSLIPRKCAPGRFRSNSRDFQQDKDKDPSRGVLFWDGLEILWCLLSGRERGYGEDWAMLLLISSGDVDYDWNILRSANSWR